MRTSNFRSLASKRAIFVFAFIFCTSFRQKNTRLSQTITGRTRHLLQTGYIPFTIFTAVNPSSDESWDMLSVPAGILLLIPYVLHYDRWDANVGERSLNNDGKRCLSPIASPCEATRPHPHACFLSSAAILRRASIRIDDGQAMLMRSKQAPSAPNITPSLKCTRAFWRMRCSRRFGSLS